MQNLRKDSTQTDNSMKVMSWIVIVFDVLVHKVAEEPTDQQPECRETSHDRSPERVDVELIVAIFLGSVFDCSVENDEDESEHGEVTEVEPDELFGKFRMRY